MTLELYDLSHTRVTVLKNHKDASVESELSGDKTLSFLWHQKNKQSIPHEFYLRTDRDEFVVKENSKSSNGYRKIVAKLNLETIEGRTWREFAVKNCTAEEAVNYALTDTGWTCSCTVPVERVRNISLTKVNSYEVLEKVQEAFTCEMEFDTFNKVVKVCEQVGSDKGAYFIEGLNLKELTDSGDTYDYATIIIPIGADDLSIGSVNGGNNYLENYQYSTKKKSVIWEDSSYTDPQALMDDARYKLNEISKPKRSFRAQTIDLARLSAQYSALEYSVGDVVTIVSGSSGIREKQRITKTVEYLENPAKNTCDISNTVLSFEDLQKKLFAAADCIDNITTNNGTVKGSSVDSIDVTQIIGLERYVAEDIDDLKVNYLYVRTEFGTPYAVIGKAILTTAEATNLKVTGREDVELSYINELHVQTFEGDTATFKTVEADNIAALEARINKITGTTITTEYLEANYAQINFANVEKESVGTLLADIGLITDATIVDGHVTGYLDSVNINANTITAGTLAVDRLVIRGSEKSLVYELNNITGALQAMSTDTLNGEVLTPRTIAADRIVAGAITSNEIAAEAITTDKIVAGAVTADKISVASLEAIVAKIGGFTIGSTALYSGTTSLGGESNGVYVGIDGISCGKKSIIEASGTATFEDVVIKNTLYGETTIKIGQNSVDVKTKILSTEQFTFPAFENYAGGGMTVLDDQKTGEGCCVTFLSMMQARERAIFKKETLFNESVEMDGGLYVKKGILTSTIYTEGGAQLPADGNVYVNSPQNNCVGYLSNLLREKISISASCNKNWNWEGKDGQPPWLWGGTYPNDMYVYNPSNFAVKSAVYDDGGYHIHNTFDQILNGYLSLNGGYMSGTIWGHAVSDGDTGSNANGTILGVQKYYNTGIFNGNGDGPGWNGIANLIIKSWYGVGFVDGCCGNGMTVGIDCRTGEIACGAVSTKNVTLVNGKYMHGTISDGRAANLIGLNSSNNVHVGNDITNTYLHGCGYTLNIAGPYICPSGDNQMSCGTSNRHWTTVYAKTGSINTSDRNKKHDIHYLGDEEYSKMTALFETLFLKCRPSTYIFNDGDRVHIGAISQDFEKIMDEIGITAQQFAGFCKDVRYDYAVYNEDGTPVEESKYIVTDAAGNVVYDYALRYQEFIFLTVHMVQRLWKMVEEADKKREKMELEVDDLKLRTNFLEKAVYSMSV